MLRPLLALLALAAGPASAQAGRYAVAGSNPGGDGRYVGRMTVTQTGETFRVVWDTGGPPVEGVGVRQGDAFAVAYGGACGVVAYAPAEGGYEAVWTTMGSTDLGAERAEETAVAGRYAVEGTNPGRDDVYRGTLVMGGAGDAAAFHWEVGGQAYDGLGLAHGGVYGVTYGAETCSVAVYTVGEDGALDGVWTGPGLDGAGTETATP